MSSVATSWAGECPAPYTPSWHSTHWKCRSGLGVARTLAASSITPTAASRARAQYLSIRYTERLEEAGAITSVCSRGDSYDNALAETVNGLYKTELIRRRRPWKTHEQVELATTEWVDWWNNRRLHSAIGPLPPAEFEEQFCR